MSMDICEYKWRFILFLEFVMNFKIIVFRVFSFFGLDNWLVIINDWKIFRVFENWNWVILNIIILICFLLIIKEVLL